MRNVINSNSVVGSMMGLHGLFNNNWNWADGTSQLFKALERIKTNCDNTADFYNKLIKIKNYINSKRFKVPGKYETIKYLYGSVAYHL